VQRAAKWLLRTTATGLAVGILQPSRDESLRAQLRQVEQAGLGGADIRREMDHPLADRPIGPEQSETS